MPVTPTYPGVYVEEIPSGVHTIPMISTSVTAFVGRAARGLIDTPVVINSFGDFTRQFGGLDNNYPMGYAVNDFFQNGGSQGVIIRLAAPSMSADDKDGQKAAQQLNDAIPAAATVDTAKAAIAAKVTELVTPANASDATKTEAHLIGDAVAAAADLPAIQGIVTDRVTHYQTVADHASADAWATVGGLTLQAISPGKWGDALQASVDTMGITDAVADRYNVAKADLFNLNIVEIINGNPARTEQYRNISMKASAGPRFVGNILKEDSTLVAVANAAALPTSNPTTPIIASQTTGSQAIITAINDAAVTTAAQAKTAAATANTTFQGAQHDTDAKTAAQAVTDAVGDAADKANAKLADVKTAALAAQIAAENPALAPVSFTGGQDGRDLTENSDYVGDEDKKTGIYALADADFNILCIPPDAIDGDIDPGIYSAALIYCVKRRAMLIVDPDIDWGKSKDSAVPNAIKGLNTLSLSSPAARNAILYYPRVLEADPMSENQMKVFAACGIIAGVMARTDATSGVWKAPAGINASLVGVRGLQARLNDAENGQLNPLGINCLRYFPIIGNVMWGSRTLRGADQLADDYKYVPIRRLALFIEESLYRGTQWVVFEPNDKPLWAQIRLNVGVFMQDLFRKGAFQGATAKEAYFVKCDEESTPQSDIDRGIVNIIVGFAPLKPAEFVIIQIQQIVHLPT